MKLKVKKLHSNAKIPTKAFGDDIGFDLTAISLSMIDEGNFGYVEYDTGIAVQPEQGWGCYVYPRSSISKTGLWLANSVALIDPGYTSSIKLRFKYVPNTEMYKVGDKVGQLVVKKLEDVEIEMVEELAARQRGAGGFGSTGS